jgi:chromosome partitioning protein
MSVILSCVNLKGGVGKTAIAVNFAAYCGSKGYKTLLVDLDPQTNATFSCISVDDWEKHASKFGTVANLFGIRQSSAEGRERTAAEIIKRKVFKNVDLLPSHLDLFTIDLDLASATARETKLRRALDSVKSEYEILVCDCPPNLTIPTQNAIAMSSHYVVPVSPDYLSGIGVGILLSRIDRLSKELEHVIKHAGIIISRVGRPAEHRTQTVNALRETFKESVFDAEIRERVAVSKAAEQHIHIFSSGDREATQEFTNVSEELLERLEV